ncbi:MAG: type IV-A pilus assembly ATPase PilB [Gammaproteobacteria bacterium]|nr:type IV-A pilus assembly ATPase PilB [Gammaproteobacteria bacterium]
MSTTDNDFPIINFVNNIIKEGIARNASDIHFEPYETTYRIRMRIDGVLYDVNQPDVMLAPRITVRIKIMAALDISEKRLPQDGRCKLELTPHQSISLRISTCPTLFGEKVVLRLLDVQTTHLGIEQLGFTEVQQQIFLANIHKQQGMILVTGPTGSGKTMTLYTALQLLNNSEKNISSAEDPVEIYLPGINQVQINNKTGLTFATALRAFLRQDPDIIMLGEIRDHETAEIAVKAAQTGHLVLSTLHTNSATETLNRLANIGIEAFNIATSINLVIAQRLLRRLCPHCKLPHVNDPRFYEATGCKHCTAGYHGRIGIFEMLPISPAISKIILEKGNTQDIEQQALKEGLINLRSAALSLAETGVTSLTEVNRVTE